MAWVETYHCDVCGAAKSEEQNDWWLAWAETFAPTPDMPEQPVLRVTPWNVVVAHTPQVLHLCGARCAQTELDRWMSPIRENVHLGVESEAASDEDAPISAS